MSDHERFREWAGAYVLGALDVDEARRFDEHLEHCDRCRRDVAELAAIPALLARVESPEQQRAPDSAMDLARSRIETERMSLVRSRRRWQRGAAAAAAVAVAAVLTFGAIELAGTQPPEATMLSIQPGAVAAAQITVTPRTWGTAIDLSLQDLPPHEGYVAWAVDRAGTWQQVAAWGPTPSGGAIVSGASSFATGDLANVVVTSADRSETLVTAAPADG
jgi:predicted anti-sigma-YlaC factor YlaD